MATTYAGLDYSLGRSNFNSETGIHFGVIAMNSINLDCTEDFEYDYGKPSCPKCGTEVKASDEVSDEDEDGNSLEWHNGKDFACVDCQECFWSDRCFGDEAIGWSYQGDGYKLADCLNNDIFVLASEYYTLAQYCSPCVPGAGNLDSPCDEGVKTYCLGHDWFEDGHAPYHVFRVADDSEVFA